MLDATVRTAVTRKYGRTRVYSRVHPSTCTGHGTGEIHGETMGETAERIRMLRMPALSTLLIVLGLVFFVHPASGGAPNTSMATLPVAYYGSSYITKSPAVYDMFSKMRVVVLMQQDGDEPAGHCWLECWCGKPPPLPHVSQFRSLLLVNRVTFCGA